MTRAAFIITLSCLAIYFAYYPPQIGHGQPDTGIKVPPGGGISTLVIDSSELIAARKEVEAQAEELRKKVEEVKQLSLQNAKELNKLSRKLKIKDSAAEKADTLADYYAGDCDTIVIKEDYVLHNEDCERRTWFGKFFKLVGECKLHGIFKHKNR